MQYPASISVTSVVELIRLCDYRFAHMNNGYIDCWRMVAEHR